MYSKFVYLKTVICLNVWMFNYMLLEKSEQWSTIVMHSTENNAVV